MYICTTTTSSTSTSTSTTLGQSWISAYKKLTPDGKSWMKLNPTEVNEINVVVRHLTAMIADNDTRSKELAEIFAIRSKNNEYIISIS